MPNFTFGVAAVMQALSSYYLIRAGIPPDPALWPARTGYLLGTNVALRVDFPGDRKPAALGLTLEMEVASRKGKPKQYRRVDRWLTAADLHQLQPLYAEQILRQLFWDLTDEGKIHPIPNLRNRVSLGRPYPQLEKGDGWRPGTRVQVGYRSATMALLPNRGRYGTIVAELDQQQMVPAYAWTIKKPKHLYLVEVEPHKIRPRRYPMAEGAEQVAYADNEIFEVTT